MIKRIIGRFWPQTDQDEPNVDLGQAGDPPLKVMFGTCPGTRSDTDALARSTVDRYMDIPDESFIYLQKNPAGGYHYEIQEGGDGHAYLPSVIKILSQEAEAVYLTPLNGRQVRVTMTKTGNLICSVLPAEGKNQPTTPDLVRKAKMQAFASTGREWIKFSVMAFSLGLLTIGTASTIHKGISFSAQGYYEYADRFSTSRLVELFLGNDIETERKSQSETPISAIQRISSINQNPRRYVYRLYFSEGDWKVESKRINLPSGQAESSESKRTEKSDSEAQQKE